MNNTNVSSELKTQIVDHNQGQTQQMQVIENTPGSPHHVPNSSAMGNTQTQQQTTTINTISPLQTLPNNQVPAEWGGGRLQVLQTSIPNQGYLPHLYPQVLMPGNILPSGLGQPPIQVITTGKPFQSGQITQQMLTAAQNKSMIGNTTGSFSGTYTLPTIPSSQSQTLLFSPVSVISSQPQQQQQNLLPAMATGNANNKSQSQQDVQKNIQNQKIMQKLPNNNSLNNNQNVTGGTSGSPQSVQQCVQVSQTVPTAQIISPLQQTGSQAMTFAPWGTCVPQFWANGLSSQTLLPPSPIIIRGTQHDGTQSMFIPQATTHQTIPTQQHNQTLTLPCNMPQNVSKSRPQIETLAPKQQQRAPQILPQNGPAAIRPASSVSTQTAQNQTIMNQKQNKMRNKQHTVRPALQTLKTDASNQTKNGLSQVQQQQQSQQHTSIQQQTMHQVVSSQGNKMVVMSTGTPINIQSSQLSQQNSGANEKQQVQMQHIKQQQQHQQAMIQQQQHLLMQQTPNQQQLLQQQIAQQFLHQQQQQQQIHQQSQAVQQANVQQNQYITQQQQQHQIQNQLIHHHQQQQHQGGIVQQIVVQPQQSSPQIPPVTVSVTGTSNLHQINLHSKSQMNLQPSLERQVPAPNNLASTMQGNTTLVNQSTQQLNMTTAMQNIATPLSSPAQQSTLQPPPNPLAAMTTLSTGALGSSPLLNSQSQNKLTEHKIPDNNTAQLSALSTPAELNNSNASSNENKSIPVSSVQALNESANEETDGAKKDINVKTIEVPMDTSQTEVNTEKQEDENKTNSDTAKSTADENISKSSLLANFGVSSKSMTAISNIKTEKDLPKAMIKPNVLTHVIEGFVIQEANEPFAVTRQKYSERENIGEPPKKRQALEENCQTLNISHTSADTSACEHCGKQEHKSKLKKKRFCSLSCARASKSSPSVDQISDPSIAVAEESIKDNNIENLMVQNVEKDQSNETLKCANAPEEYPMMIQWTVSDVCEFIKNLPGCSDYADDFAMQEIDGQALLLLKENHLVNTMGMKLGPALKIVAKVESMKEGVGADKEQQ